MIRAIIADDEESMAGLIRDVLERTGEVEVLGVASDGLSCLRMYEELKPDALFLDIKMSQLSGIEVAENLIQTDSPPLIAFVTNYDEYAVRAFDLQAVDYVIKMDNLKSFEERVQQTVRRMEAGKKSKAPVGDEIKELVSFLARQHLHPSQRKIPVREADGVMVRLLDPVEVVYITQQGQRVMLVTGGGSYPAYYTLENIEERLSSEGFFRANLHTLVNSLFIDRLATQGDGMHTVEFSSRVAKDILPDEPIQVDDARAHELIALLKRPAK